MTIKQKKAIALAVENGGNVSKAMRDAGYSPNTAKNPSKLTDTQVWQELVEKHLPDDVLLAVNEQGLQAWKVHSSHTEPDKEIPDFATRAKYLELGYRLKRRIGPDTQVNVLAQSGGDMSLELISDEGQMP